MDATIDKKSVIVDESKASIMNDTLCVRIIFLLKLVKKSNLVLLYINLTSSGILSLNKWLLQQIVEL
jgi:hypothetical protein